MIATLPPIEVSRVGRAQRAVAAATVEEAMAELEVLANEIEERRTMREHRRLVRATPQCAACYRFLRNPAHECPGCGYLDGRGYRP